MRWPFCKHLVLKDRNCPYCIRSEKRARDRRDNIGTLFKQKCVFAHSELEGDKRLFQMASGAAYLAELVEISGRLGHSADDTAQRDLTWKILDTIVREDDPRTAERVFTCPRYGSIRVTYESVANGRRSPWEIANDAFLRKFFPEQFSRVRFLRG